MGERPKPKERIVYQAGLLGGYAALAAALLILGNEATRETIAERQAEDMLESLAQVLPDSLHDNDLLEDRKVVRDDEGNPVVVYTATKKGGHTGFAFATTGRGYAGDIELILGVDTDGKLLGVRVIAHAETPGLGDKIEIEKDDWILGFDGRSLENTTKAQWRVKKDGGEIDALTGATITPRAVVEAVYGGLVFFRDHRGTLIAGEPSRYANTLENEEGAE